MVTPIDPDFMKHRTVVGKGEGGAYDIWGPVEPLPSWAFTAPLSRSIMIFAWPTALASMPAR